MSAAHVSDGHTRSAIIQMLLQGPVTASAIGERLGISAAGVRRHLDALIEAGDAQATAAAAWQHTGRGRPAKRYRLTAAGRAKLGHTYDDLAAAAMRQLREIGGDDAVRTFARRRIDTILSGVAQGADGVESTAGRVAEALTEAGYATTTTRVSGPIDGVQICQHHCPVAHAAERFPQLCEAETEFFAELLGTHVQRLATIAHGDGVCTTFIPKGAQAAAPAPRSAKATRTPPTSKQTSKQTSQTSKTSAKKTSPHIHNASASTAGRNPA